MENLIKLDDNLNVSLRYAYLKDKQVNNINVSLRYGYFKDKKVNIEKELLAVRFKTIPKVVKFLKNMFYLTFPSKNKSEKGIPNYLIRVLIS